MSDNIKNLEHLLKLAKQRGVLGTKQSTQKIPRFDRQTPLPLSFSQQRLWFLDRFDASASVAYHITSGLYLKGVLNTTALIDALNQIVARHEVLRTQFKQSNDIAIQHILPEHCGFPLSLVDLSDDKNSEASLQALITEQNQIPFDLQNGRLIRGCLVHLSDTTHGLVLCLHHSIADGWSMGIFLQELEQLYDAFHRQENNPLPPLTIQFADYTHWQFSQQENQAWQTQLNYWQSTLKDAPPLLELPTDFPRPSSQSFQGERIPVLLNRHLSAQIKALAQRHGMTLHMLLLGTWSLLLSRLSTQDDIVVGTPIANRHPAETEPLIGFFVNTVAVRIKAIPSQTIQDFLEHVRQQCIQAQNHADVPFDLVVKQLQPERNLAYSPIYQVIFAWQNTPQSALNLPGLSASPLELTTDSIPVKLDMAISLSEQAGQIQGELDFASALFKRESVERYLDYWYRILATLANDYTGNIHDIAIMTAEEEKTILSWGQANAPYSHECCIHQLFESCVQTKPNAIALVDTHNQLSYQQLNQKANNLARRLISRGIRPDTPVAVLIPRQSNLIVAMLAIMKAGGGYVPLDPSYPQARLQYMIDDCSPALIITDQEILDRTRIQTGNTPVLLFEEDNELWINVPVDNIDPLDIGLTPRHLAYVIYTSGSTGRPKGVMIEHRGLSYLAQTQKSQFDAGAGSRVLQFNAISFDASLFDMVMGLCTGAALYLPGTEQLLGADLQSFLQCHAITHATLPPAALSTLDTRTALPDLKVLITAGEAITFAAIQPWLVGRKVYNAYGPTETTIWATLFAVNLLKQGLPPIGRPIAHTSIYILDAHGQPVPIGVTGEMYIGGDSIARGYLNRPDLTATHFLPDPFSEQANARMYRTGDLGRWSSDGEIEFQGRNNEQVKIRGFRIEPGEIESELQRCPGVQEAVVNIRGKKSGNPQLVAYFTKSGLITCAPADLKAQLAKTLPYYMIPAAFVALRSLPLTPHGKVDHKALPAPAENDFIQRDYQAPKSDTEVKLARIWESLIGLSNIGRYDHFFDLGGHSLMAVQLVSRIREQLKRDIPLSLLFEHPILHELAATILEVNQQITPSNIQPRAQNTFPPLSLAQQRLWFLSQMDPLSTSAYVMTGATRICGPLNSQALEKALNRIYSRQEALRTHIALVDGKPVQMIDETARHFPLQFIDASDQASHSMESTPVFSVNKGPLVQGQLIRINDQEHHLFITMHHIISDGWSMSILMSELCTLYNAFHHNQPDPLPLLDIQYSDYADWQRHYVQGTLLQKQQSYWVKQLANAPECLGLPTDHPRPPTPDYRGSTISLTLDRTFTDALKRLGQQHGCTLFMTLLASWTLLLSRLSGQEQIVIGTPVAGRTHREVENLIGMFVNTLAIRINIDDTCEISALLEQVKETVIQAQTHQDIPFEQVVEAVGPVRNPSHAPLFQVLFCLQNVPEPEQNMSELTLDTLPVLATTSQLDLSLYLNEINGCIKGHLNFATALFDEATVQRYLDYWKRLLHALITESSHSIQTLPFMSDREKTQLLSDFNNTDQNFPDTVCLHHLFEQQVDAHPKEIAVVCEGEQLSFEELNRQANQLAHWMICKGVKPDCCVAIAMERQCALIVSILATLKAGGAYIPIDPGYPTERLQMMMEDSTPVIMLVDHSMAKTTCTAALNPDHIFHIHQDKHLWAELPEVNPEVPELTSKHLVYVIFTSGSTGRPKGVMVEHRNVVNFLCDQQQRHQLTAQDKLLAVTTVSFDIHVLEIYLPLISGAQLHLATREQSKNGHYLQNYLSEQQVSIFQATPATWKLLIEAGWQGTQTLKALIGGEAFSTDLVQELLHRTGELWNMYGPTESTVWSSCWPIESAETPIRIGKPMANTQIYILDKSGEPVPLGITGEIFIAGQGVVRGYLKQPDLTAERFISNPFCFNNNTRMYCTGDSGRWLSDGTIEYQGRNDGQVKVRGCRIELGDIETAIRTLNGVIDTVVIIQQNDTQPQRIIAYYVSNQKNLDLRSHLAIHLPDYMIPAAFVRLDEMPLTPNNKVNRRALPKPDKSSFTTEIYEEPQNDLERLLADIWKTLLGLDPVGRHDHFFESGGHSLLATQLVNHLRQHKIELPLTTLFSFPRLSDLAKQIQSGQAHQPNQPIAFRHTGSQKPLFIIPEATGEMLYGSRLTESIDDDIPVYGLIGPNRYHPTIKTIEKAAERYVHIIRTTQPQGPYRMLGWSFGGVLAYEIASQLLEQQQEIQFLGLIDSRTPALTQTSSKLAHLSEADILNLVSRETVIRLAMNNSIHLEVDIQQEISHQNSWQAHYRLAMSFGILPQQWSENYYQHWLCHMRDLIRCDYQPKSSDIEINLFIAQIKKMEDIKQPEPYLGWDRILPKEKIRTTSIVGKHDLLMTKPYVEGVGQAISRAIKNKMTQS